MAHLTELTITEALTKLRAKEISAVELTRAYLDRINQLEHTINAYITLTPEHALLDARKADESLARGENRPLNGIPMSIKDVLSTADVDTTCGSKILEGYVPVYTATAAQRLFDAGVVMLGKANMDEFAMGSSTEKSAYAVTHNPWNTERVPGDSSGGSAASVAARMAAGSVGTDTGGSIRQPG